MKKVYLLIVVVNLVLGAAQLGLSHRRATDGLVVAEADRRRSQLELQNQRLLEEVYLKSALVYVQKQVNQGQLQPARPQFVNPALPVAVAHPTADRP